MRVEHGSATANAKVEAQESGGVLLAVNSTPVPTKSTASIALASTAKGAVTAKPEALELCAEGKNGRERECSPNVQHSATRGPKEHVHDMALQYSSTDSG